MKKYFIFALIIGTLVLPRLSLAATSAEIQAQINAIMAQIKQLQVQLTQLQTQQTSAVWCHDFNVNLGIGNAADSEVGALWTALGKEGFSVQAGKFDETTASAITGFQQKYKDEILTPWGLNYGTGYVGKTTRAKLNKLYGCGGNVIPPPFACTQIACASNQKTVCPAGLGDNGCPLPCKCVPGPIECAEPICQPGYTRYDAGEKDVYSCPIIKCLPSTSNQLPVISGVSGPTTLKMFEVGTWTVKASDPEQGTLTYSVKWGDEAFGAGLEMTAPRIYIQTATFTHSYSKAGIYNPTFTVTDDKGLSAKTSISVTVGGVITETGAIKISVYSASTCSPCPINAECFCAQTQTILNNAKVSVYNQRDLLIGSKDTSSGSAVFEKLPVGIYTAVASAEGYENSKTEFKIAANVGSYLSIYLNKSSTFSITVLSPNGGEAWTKGTTQTIKWQNNIPIPLCPAGASCVSPAPKYYDIKLVSYYPPCTGEVCPALYIVPYTIAKNIQGSSYNWSVGKYLEVYGTGTGGIAPDGSYTIQICQTNSTTCDSSDSYFKIVSGSITPSITSLQPTSGPVGTSVTITGNRFTSTDNSVKFGGGYLNGLSSNGTTITFNVPDGLTPCPPGGTVCIRSFMMVTPGSYSVSVINSNGTSNAVNFTVTSGIQPSITVLSPNGGETWAIGSTQTISWNSTNAPSGSWVALYLTNGSFIAQGLAATGSYSWQIPTQYCSGDVCGFPLQPGNNYKIEARLYTGPSICLGLCPSTTSQPTLLSKDSSDAPFSIVAAGSAIAPSGQYSASILENMKITLDQIQKAINDLYR